MNENFCALSAFASFSACLLEAEAWSCLCFFGTRLYTSFTKLCVSEVSGSPYVCSEENKAWADLAEAAFSADHENRQNHRLEVGIPDAMT